MAIDQGGASCSSGHGVLCQHVIDSRWPGFMQLRW